MRLLARSLGVTLVGVLVLALTGAPTTLAAFTDTALTTSPDSLASAGVIAVPATPTATDDVATGRVALAWPATPVGSSTAGTYAVWAYDTPDGGAGQQVCAPQAATSCTVPRPAAGVTRHYAVRAFFAQAWSREGGRRAFTSTAPSDTAAPVLTLTAPTQGLRYPATTVLRLAVVGCAGLACGSVDEPATVTYTFRRSRNGSSAGGQVSCWSGQSWAGTTACPTLPASRAGTTWTVPGAPGSGYENPNGTGATFVYELAVTAVDASGNSRTTTYGWSADRDLL